MGPVPDNFKMVSLPSIALLLLCATASLEAQRLVGHIDVDYPGFSSLYIHEDATDPTKKYSLMLSTYNPVPLTSDTSYIYRHIGKYLDDLSAAKATALGERYTWPREAKQTPVDVFGSEAITQPDGSSVPGKNAGSIHVVRFNDQNSPKSVDILYDFFDFDAWFYYSVVWRDMDGDGRKDALASRGYRDPFSGTTTTQLVWFKQPTYPFEELPWKSTVISKDTCDSFSVLVNLDGQDALFTVGYYTQKLMVHWSNHPEGLWANPDDIESRVIDTGLPFYHLEAADLNGDGREELLVTIPAQTNGILMAYEIPSDFKEGVYGKHTLASGFDSRTSIPNGGAPGAASAFYPGPSGEGRPFIVLSGDHSGIAYYLRAQSEDPSDWSYELVIIHNEGNIQIIDKISVADVDGDGYKEIFIPSYFQNKLHVYSFKP